MRLIDADALVKKFQAIDRGAKIVPQYVWEAINSCKTITIAQTDKTGYWQVMNCLDGKARAFCSECSKEGDGGDTCPSCGARMIVKRK